MKIAIEAHALSQDKITGVGTVILHYMNELQKIDSANEYFIYSMDDLKHVEFRNPLWQHVDFQYLLKKIRIRVWLAWNGKRSGTGPKGLYTRVLILVLRLLKIFLELLDEAVFSFKLASSIKKNGIDVYLGTSTYYYPYFFLSPVKKAGILYDLVWELFPETMEFGNKIRMKLFTLRNMRKLDLLVAISSNTKKDAQEILGLDNRIEAIPLAADGTIFYRAGAFAVSSVKKKYGITKKYILSVCTLEPRKNLRALLEAYRTMPSRRKYQLVLVGMAGWINTDFFREIEASDVRENVLITGYVPNTELAPIYTGAELFVFPTLYEGFGLPVLEAMQCGCPVITSNTSSIPEVAGDAAIMVDPLDVAGLSQMMEKAVSRATLRSSLSSNGLKRSRQFSWEQSAIRLLNSLMSLK
jgi:glycosyltransferase involved in cell wall biosynthesis